MYESQRNSQVARWLVSLLAGAIVLQWVSCADAQEPSEQVLLVKNGQTRCVVVTSKQSSGEVEFAIADLVRCIKVMSGATVPVVYNQKDTPPGLLPIRIGIDNKDPFFGKAGTNQAFILRVSKQAVVISGTSAGASGTMFGVYDFIEQLGVRWFMPGELGEVIPRRKTVMLPFMVKLAKPDFVGRRIQYSGHYPAGGQTEIWERRVKLRPTSGIPGSHAFRKWMPKEKYFEEHPEYYALINGKRDPSQLCTSNPDVVRIFTDNILTELRRSPRDVVPVGPNDGGTFCSCDSCLALDAGDWDPHYNRVSATDRMITFFNQIATRVTKEFPSTRFSFYMYVTHRRPPVKVKPHPNIAGMIAPIKLCVIHGPGQKQCPQRSVEWAGLVRDWTALGVEVWSRDYGSILWGGSFLPLSLTHRWRDEVPFCKKAGITGFRVETWVSWAGQMLDPYLMAKLWWDADLDVDALIDDYFANFFGPAAKPMKSYWKRLDDATANTSYHAISLSYLNLPHWYSSKIAQAGKTDLGSATRLAATNKQKKRIALWRLSNVALENWLASVKQMEAGQFKKAGDSFQKVYDVNEAGNTLLGGDPPFTDFYAFVHLYQDWDQSCRTWEKVPHYSKVAAQRVTGGNELVAVLPKIWMTQIDPMKLGQTQEWYRPDVFSATDWVPRDTHTSAMNQGLANYKDSIWYRCTVKVPQRFEGRKIMLFFAGLRRGDVWVNGKEIGNVQIHQPREIDVSEGLVFGAKNHIVVRTKDHGVFRPSFLWSPPTK